MHMARAQTIVQFTEELVALLDEEAARRGVSRSALIREAVSAYFADSEDARIGRAIAEGYRRIPPGTPDAWGDPETLTRASSRRLLQRLEEEERDDPW